MLLHLVRAAWQAENGVEVRPSFAVSLNGRDLELLTDLQMFVGCGWIRESKTDRTFKYEARAVDELLDPIIPHFERHPSSGEQGEQLCGVCGRLPDDRARRSSAAGWPA